MQVAVRVKLLRPAFKDVGKDAGGLRGFPLEALAMNRTIDRLKLIFLGVFFLGAAGAWAYQILWVKPAKECENQQRWWDPETRTCATPLYIPALTGRPEGMSREEWGKQQAAKKLRDEAFGPNAGPRTPPTPAPKAEPEKPAAKQP